MTNEQIKTLLAIESANDINSLEIVDEFIDDHLMCAIAKINDVEMEFMWHDNLHFLNYYDESKRAFEKLLRNIHFSCYLAIEEIGIEEMEMDEQLRNWFIQKSAQYNAS